MKIDNQIIKEKSNKNMLEELKEHSKKIWGIQFEFRRALKEVGDYGIKIEKIIKKYEKECQKNEICDDEIWGIQFKFRSILKDVYDYTIKIEKIIEKYEKEEQADENR